MSGTTFFVLSLIIQAAFLLYMAYGIYADVRHALMCVRLKWQRFLINRHLARHGIAHEQVLPALMELDAFSFECGGEIWTCRRGENGKYDFTRKQETATPALENQP